MLVKVHRFWNKFAAKWCKRFPPYLHYLVKLEMLIGVGHMHSLPLSCYRKKLHNLSHLNCDL